MRAVSSHDEPTPHKLGAGLVERPCFLNILLERTGSEDEILTGSREGD